MALSKLQSFELADLKNTLHSFARYLLNLGEDVLYPAAKDHPTLTAIVLVTFTGHAYYWHKFSFWSRRNVKTPRPVPVFGNFLAFLLNYRQHLEFEWPKRFGKIYGYYVGTSPRLVIADARVVKNICVRDFNAFPNHHFFNVPNKYQQHFLIFQKDDHWRGMRGIMTPTFSSGRIKGMYQLLSECADELCREHVRRIESGKPEVDTRQIYGSFSMSSALKSFYGLNLSLNPELQREIADKQQVGAASNGSGQVKATSEQLTAATFARRSREAFKQNLLRFTITNILPAKLLAKLNFHGQSETGFTFFAQSVRKIIEQRQQSKGKFNDYLQLLLEAKANEEIKRTESEKHEAHHAIDIDRLEAWRPSKMSLTETEVYCQGMMLMMVATETTSTLIAHTIYLLAHNQHIQDRLYEEILKIAREPSAGDEQNNNNNSNSSTTGGGQQFKSFNYDELISCDYLDCVISESLRLMTPVVAMDRKASEDYYIEEYDIRVPKGTIIYLAYYAIHNDPEYWPEPGKFDPDRFNSENKHKIVPGSYSPFGIGPRACIGFRFGLAEAKVGIAKLLCDFRFTPAPGTKYPAEPMKPIFVQNDFKDLRVLISRR